MPKALITTIPFGEKNRLPLELLEGGGVDYLINPLGRRLKEMELAEMVGDVDVLIAGSAWTASICSPPSGAASRSHTRPMRRRRQWPS